MKRIYLITIATFTLFSLQAMEEEPQFRYCDPKSHYSLDNNRYITFEPTYEDEKEYPFFLTLHKGEPKGIAFGLSRAKEQMELIDFNEKGIITGIDVSEDYENIAVCRENGIITVFSATDATHVTIKVTLDYLLAVKFFKKNIVGAYSKDKLHLLNFINHSIARRNTTIQMPEDQKKFLVSVPLPLTAQKD